MKIVAFSVLSAGLIMSGAAQAKTNLLANGSFETGMFTSWGQHNLPGQFPAIVVDNPGIASTEPTGGSSPDPVGTHYAVFRGNPDHESITQRVFLPPGVYKAGFTAQPNHYENPGEETFTVSVGGVPVASIDSSNTNADQWYLISGTITIESAGTYVVRFKYDVKTALGRDLFVDRLYLVSH